MFVFIFVYSLIYSALHWAGDQFFKLLHMEIGNFSYFLGANSSKIAQGNRSWLRLELAKC